MEMDIAEISLDDIIAKNQKAKKSPRGGRNDNRGRNDGPRGGSVSKKSNQWGHDKFFEVIKGRGSRSGNQKAVCRFSNIPFHISQEELKELFHNYTRITRVVLHHDDRGNSLGTAEVHGPHSDIERLYNEFDRCEIDGRQVKAVILNEGGSSSGGPIVERARRNGGGDGGKNRRSNNVSSGIGGGGDGRRGGRGPREPKKKKLTAEELDRELDEYMKNKGT